jgi:hypothetical protein
MQTLAIGRDVGKMVVYLGQDNVFGSSVELHALFELPVGAQTHVGHDSKLL